MTAAHAAYLARAAAAEVASREKHYPAMIEAGEIGEGDAAADLDAWRAIAAIMALDPGPDGSGWAWNPLDRVGTDIGWEALNHAASRAVVRLAERIAAAPVDVKLRDRRAAVATIADCIAEEGWFWTGGRGPRPSREDTPQTVSE